MPLIIGYGLHVLLGRETEEGVVEDGKARQGDHHAVLTIICVALTGLWTHGNAGSQGVAPAQRD